MQLLGGRTIWGKCNVVMELGWCEGIPAGRHRGYVVDYLLWMVLGYCVGGCLVVLGKKSMVGWLCWRLTCNFFFV